MRASQPVRVASTDLERDNIFRFRYRIFVEHLARLDLDGANHQARLLTDVLDAVSTHYYLGEPQKPIAALSVTPLSSTLIPRELAEFLDLKRLAEAAPLEQAILANWLLIEPSEAGSPMVTALMVAVIENALVEGVELLLTFCRPGLVNFYERLGFEQYRHATDLKGIGLRCPLLLVLRDEARLRAMHSPLYRILRRSGGASSSDAVRLKLEPLIDMFQASQILITDDLWIEGDAKLVERTRPRLFDGLPEDGVRHIMKLASLISCKAGETITRQGETSDDMFLVAAGHFIARNSAGANRAIGEGDLFGDIEHLSGLARSETVVSQADSHIAAIKADTLFRWIHQNPETGIILAINLARVIAMRIAR
jgi:N-acyl-L-homoserine lactone synthetase